MRDIDAKREIRKLIETFTSKAIKKEHFQFQNQPLESGKPFTAPHNEIWAQVSFGGGDKRIVGLADKPCTRTTGMLFIQLFAPRNTGTDSALIVAEKLAEHVQFYRIGGLELQASSVIEVPNNPDFYQVNVHTPYTVN
ncbi:phage tail terminator-like protein [Acinetobacter bereziniae]|uniref:phage tail terminator-like protein n=1 Tax=Acinetobacter bereziniae TaxID=106648 RepID=UPI00124EBD7E|nr:phage tail terminator-like protein [Acinetobacter bereziniae]